jgi:hypothetical protein
VEPTGAPHWDFDTPGESKVPPTGKVFQLPGAGGVDICGPGAVYKQRKVLVGRSKHRHMRPSLFTDGVVCGFLVRRVARAITGGTIYLWVQDLEA